MIQPLPPPPLPEPNPEAVITRQGRWIYHVDIVDGMTAMNSPWVAFGRRHAERKARKKLAWYMRRFAAPERWTIRPAP